MRAWWDRTLEYFADYIAVYGWADPTSSLPPTWIDDPDLGRRDADGQLTCEQSDPLAETRR